MKRSNVKLTVILGVVCALLLALSTWWSVAFNDARLVVPTDFSTLQLRDLPMALSIVLSLLYLLYLCVLFLRALIASKRRTETANTTRQISPKLGLCGFCGFFGLLGFWTYSVDKVIFPFAFFVFFGFFGFFYEGKMSGTFMDERYRENVLRARLNAHRAALAIVFLSVLLVSHGALLGNLEYTLIAVVILVSLALALDVFLSEYLLYRYDHDDRLDADGEG